MQFHKQLIKSVLGKAALAAAALGGFLFFSGAPSAQAHEWNYYRGPVVRREVFVNRGYFGPRVGYFGPRHEVFVHGWRDRFGCWHRY